MYFISTAVCREYWNLDLTDFPQILRWKTNYRTLRHHFLVVLRVASAQILGALTTTPYSSGASKKKTARWLRLTIMTLGLYGSTVDQGQAGASASKWEASGLLTSLQYARIIPRGWLLHQFIFFFADLIIIHQNGPLRMNQDQSIAENPHAWSKQADTIWVDQPGIRFAT